MDLKSQFPMLSHAKMHGKPLIYLDTAATSHKPQKVIDSIAGFYKDHYATVLRGVYGLAEEANQIYQAAREKVKDFIHAGKSCEIIFTRGCTDSINLAASSFGKGFIKPGDTILITQMEHHSNLVPWQFVSEERGANLAVVPIDDKGEIRLDVLEKMLKELKPKIFAVTHVSNVLGTVNPIKEMAKLAHTHGAKILVDGAQAIQHIPVDVQDLDVDFYAFSGHKLYGPNGVGVLYGKETLLNEIPPYQGGGAMVHTVTFEKTSYIDLPWKFEAGTMMLAEIAGLGTAVDFIQEIGFKEIQAHEEDLIQYALKRFKEIPGIHIYGQPKKRESVIGFTVEGVHALDIGTLLDLKGIAIRTGNHCAQPLLRLLEIPSMARISFGLYNTRDDIDKFIEALKDVIQSLK